MSKGDVAGRAKKGGLWARDGAGVTRERDARGQARERAHKVKERCGYVVCESYDGKCWFIENRCLRNAGKWNERLKARVWFLKEAI